MKSSFVSTLSWTTSALKSMSRLQTEISKSTVELATGRHADVGLTLGLKTGQSVSLYAMKASIEAQTQSNTFASSVLKTSQAALSQIQTTGDDFFQGLITGASSGGDPKLLVDQANSALSTLADSVNTTDGQRYVFGGTNSSKAPLNAYENGPEAAVNAAFFDAFNILPTDPAVSQISASDMSAFLDGPFAALFADPSLPVSSWGTWSNASDQPLTSQVSSTSRVDISTTANTSAIRNLTMAMTMVAKLGTANLSADARNVVVEKARTVAGAGVSQVTSVSAGLGVAQNRVDRANDILTSAGDLVDSRITSLEGVDPAEVKTKIDNMTTQLQMSYSTTATLMQLSLLNYA
ncbi:flagellar hook-associated family protein [Xanthobacter sediminis]